MDTTRFLPRFTFLLALTAATNLGGCAAQEQEEDTEESASSEEMLSGAGIVPQISIRGVSLGMTPRGVQTVLGRPDRMGRLADGNPYWYAYGLTSIHFSPEDHRVQWIVTRSPGVRTKDGVGIGSYKNAVDAIPFTQCTSNVASIELKLYRHFCEVRNASVHTYFSFPEGKNEEFEGWMKVEYIVLAKN